GKLKGEAIYPRSTILSEHTLVVIPKNIHPGEREIVYAFVQFLWSDPAQRLFVKNGFRSVKTELNDENPHFGHIPDLFSIQDFGGEMVKLSLDGHPSDFGTQIELNEMGSFTKVRGRRSDVAWIGANGWAGGPPGRTWLGYLRYCPKRPPERW